MKIQLKFPTENDKIEKNKAKVRKPSSIQLKLFAGQQDFAHKNCSQEKL